MLEESGKKLVVYLHLTMNCNLECKYCYSGKKRNERMSLSVGQKAIDFFLDRTEQLTVRFIGGEPLLEIELLRQIVEYCTAEATKKNKKSDYVIVTNGTLFSKEFSDFCRHHRVEVSLSFDGSREAQDTNRIFPSGEGSFDVVEKNIPYMLQNNPYTHVVRVVTPSNTPFLAESVRYLFSRGLRNITLSPDYTHPNLQEYIPAIREQYYKIADLYLEYRKKGKWAFINIFEPPDSIYYKEQMCRLGEKDFSVDPFGNIYPCCNFVDQQKYLLGNVHQGIIENKREIFLKDLKQLDECIQEFHKDCPSTSRCRRRCGCTNMVTTGKLNAISPVLCLYGKMEAEVRDYLYSRF